MRIVDLAAIGCIPMAGDNAAIANLCLPAGLRFAHLAQVHALSHTVPEGHRFAIEAIAPGARIRSWGLPFGTALREIRPGEYLCNAGVLDALKLRNVDFTLPPAANFKDHLAPFALDERAFRPGRQVPLHARPGSFPGYARPGGRGVGTRNFVLVLGTSSRTGSFAKALEARLRGSAPKYADIDGIVAVSHTEGGGGRPNNLELLLRTLAGFMVHPNVAAALAVDYGSEAVSNRRLEAYLREQAYPLDHVPHRFYTIEGGFGQALEATEQIVRAWLPAANAVSRTPQPLAELKVALQCGGSDAFSGVSGNPLAARVAKELIKHGGSAALAETDELIGAEPYVLANTRDLATARRFLDTMDTFKARVAWHGHSAEGNPSAGNRFRGLYNLAIKSIGAARKKDPEVRLDYVVEYAQRMREAGFYFMDSPGNDLESIAGQVAAGCNLIFFITGNGSVTNFPFVPTIKFVTTTGRWNLLAEDMDVNAGRYLDGTPMETLGAETFDYTLGIASGARSAGERAGHAQVSIWRDWRQTDDSNLEQLRGRAVPDGRPIAIAAPGSRGRLALALLPSAHGFACDQIGLIVPTSLCSGQIARMIAEDLNARGFAIGRGISRIVALVHTEGCGASGGENEEHYLRTVVGHLLHPFVSEALLLEHGCERTHNDLLRQVLRERGIDADRFGYASVQLDGGIERVVAKVEHWFDGRLALRGSLERRAAGPEAMTLGLMSAGPPDDAGARTLAQVAGAIAAGGGTVVIAQNASVLESRAFREAAGWHCVPAPSLAYGQTAERPGVHLMASPTDHMVETLTGLGGTGVQIILAHVAGAPLQGHPMIPLLQITTDAETAGRFQEDLDCAIDSGTSDAERSEKLLRLIADTASGRYRPRLWLGGNTDFQLTRGLLGVSL